MPLRRRLDMLVRDDLMGVADLITTVDPSYEPFGERPAVIFATAFEFGHRIDRFVIVPEIMRPRRPREGQGRYESYAQQDLHERYGSSILYRACHSQGAPARQKRHAEPGERMPRA
jgi:hypothetical protein